MSGTRRPEDYRQRLIELREGLLELTKDSEQATRPVELDQSRVGRLSRMDAMQLQQMAKESKRRRQHKLLAIDGALRRIETGQFGSCHVCGDEIDTERLRIDPTATRCVRCMA